MNHQGRPQRKDGAEDAEDHSPKEGLAALTVNRHAPDSLSNVIPEIDIWRVANLMLKRYGEEADIESAIRAEELAEKGDWTGEAIWRRIIDAIGQLENTTPPGPLH
jgi:hypothetical protein